ncbi:MAG: VTT domain-containing protein [Myxococcota bacterium]|nr:VTT domain-containing protein [Myxococcota bacterium]
MPGDAVCYAHAPRARAVTLSRTARRVILGVFVVAFVGGALFLWVTGSVTPTSVGAWLESLGPAAPAIFIAAFIGGAFLGLPGMAFVIGGRLAFGPWLGFTVGYVGGLLAVTLPFLVARRVRRAGADPWRPRHRWLVRAFALLETHPFWAVVLLRLVLWFNPPLSYALAFTPIPLRTYLAACAVALAPVVAVGVIATSWFL